MSYDIRSDEFPPICRRQVLPVNILTQMNDKSGCIRKFPACGQISFLELNWMITDVITLLSKIIGLCDFGWVFHA
jgi:hypothetical protein